MAEIRPATQRKQGESQHLQRHSPYINGQVVEINEEVTMNEKLVKVIDALDHCVRIDCNHCPYRGDDNGGWNCHEMQNDAIELLKFYKEHEHEVCANCPVDKDYEEVIRCKDCKRRGTYQCPVYVGGDGMCSEPDDWFCADGERKEGR